MDANKTVDLLLYINLIHVHGGGAEVIGKPSWHGDTAADRPGVIVRRVDDAGDDIVWGHAFGPLNAMPYQRGRLIEVALAPGANPRLAASWVPTGRSWPLGTDAREIVRVPDGAP
jgi:hypothetical protein